MSTIQTLSFVNAHFVSQFPSPVICLNSDYRIETFNHHAENLYGWLTFEVIGKPIYELLPDLTPYVEAPAVSMYEFALKNGRWKGNLSQKKIDGSYCYVQLSVAPVSDENGRFHQWIIAVHDISDWHQAESTVRDTYQGLEEQFMDHAKKIEKRNQQLKSYAQRLEILHRLDRAILSVNSKDEVPPKTLKRLLELTQWDSVSVTRINLEAKRATIIGEYPDLSSNHHLMKKISLKPYEDEIDQLKDGNPIFVRDMASYAQRNAFLMPLYAEGYNTLIVTPLIARGELIGTLNIASSKVMQIRPAVIEIIQEVADSLATSLYQARLIDRLQEKTAALQVRNKELAQFAYVASHDLQEPLRMVQAYMTLLQRRFSKQLPKDAQEFIDFAVEGSDRMKVLINDLLNYSRLGKVNIPFETVDCNDVLHTVQKNLLLKIQDNNVSIELDELPILQGCESQLVQLFQNLVSNAIKFKQDDAPQIKISVEPQNDYWLFSVADNGIGIDTAYRDEIFKIFRRLHSRESYGGTGIGLAICKKIVERHNGRVWFDSELGQGTTFYFTIAQ
ncbi:MAG: ATP-binding protein [Chloroflexota bacterium]